MKRELTVEVYKHLCRNIWPERGPCPAIAGAPSSKRVSRGRPRPTASAYYRQFRPVVFILRLVGRYSLQYSSKEGKWRSEFWSWSMLYCLINYSWQTYIAMIVCFRRVQALIESQEDYDEFIFSIHVLAYLSIHFHVPFTYWLQGCKMAHYLNSWADFQVNWETTFNESLELVYKNKIIIYITIIIPTTVLFLGFEKYATLHDPWLYFLPYFFTIISTAVILGFWYCTCLELKRISGLMSEKLVKARKSLEDKPNLWLVCRWRHLYLELRQLSEWLGEDLAAVVMSIMVTFSTTFLLGLYNALVQLITFISWKAAGYVCASSISLVIVFTICDAGHRATSGVATCTLAAVLKAKISMIPSDIRHEITLILESIKAEPPKIQLGGFVTINRPLVVSLVSNTLTYLIVLLQFKVNEKEK